MARRGMVVDDAFASVVAPSVLNSRVLAVLADRDDCSTASISMDRIVFARSFRPVWAIVLACVFGITIVGLAFLLVRSTETFSCSVEERHDGVVLRVRGRVHRDVLAAIAEAASTNRGAEDVDLVAQLPQGDRPAPRSRPLRSAPGGSNPWILPPPGGFDSLNEARGQTTARASIPIDDRTRSIVKTRERGGSWSLRLADDTVVKLGALVLVGRDPAPGPGEEAAALVSVSDPSVSKTHAAFGTDGSNAWVVDRHSTNGTLVLMSENGAHRLSPGASHPLANGAVVRLGEAELRVESQ